MRKCEIQDPTRRRCCRAPPPCLSIASSSAMRLQATSYVSQSVCKWKRPTAYHCVQGADTGTKRRRAMTSSSSSRRLRSLRDRTKRTIPSVRSSQQCECAGDDKRMQVQDVFSSSTAQEQPLAPPSPPPKNVFGRPLAEVCTSFFLYLPIYPLSLATPRVQHNIVVVS